MVHVNPGGNPFTVTSNAPANGGWTATAPNPTGPAPAQPVVGACVLGSPCVPPTQPSDVRVVVIDRSQSGQHHATVDNDTRFNGRATALHHGTFYLQYASETADAHVSDPGQVEPDNATGGTEEPNDCCHGIGAALTGAGGCIASALEGLGNCLGGVGQMAVTLFCLPCNFIGACFGSDSNDGDNGGCCDDN